MNALPFSARLKRPLLCGLALLALAAPVRAQIGYLNGPSPIETEFTTAPTVATLNPATFTVGSGASVLVVFYGGRTQGASPAPTTDPGEPTNMTWNGHALTKAIAQSSTASTWDDNAIYYLFNPPAGTGSITGQVPGTSVGPVTQTYWMAYTLTNVSTTTALLTGAVVTTSGSNINNTVSGLTLGDWAAYNASVSANSVALAVTISPTNATVLPNVDGTTGGNTTQNFGAVSNCPAGSLEFLCVAPGQSTAKIVMVEAIFTPSNPPPPAPALNVTTANPVQVDLSWIEAPNSFATSYILKRSTNSSGPFTDYTNVLSPTILNYTDANVVSGTTYYYTVAAANASGTNFSTTNSATPVGAPFPPLLGVGASGTSNITLHWMDFGATNYLVLRSTNSGGETQIAMTTNNTYVDTGLTPGTNYYYEVEAVGIGGTSPPSVEASAVALGSGWHLFDNFSLDTVNTALNGQTGSAGLGTGWVNLGGGTPITVTNSATFGGANYAQYTPGSVANIGDYEAGLGIAGTSKSATVFLEFSLPGIVPGATNVEQSGANAVAMNFDIDNSSPPGALTGASATGPSAQFNYDNTSGAGYLRVLSGSTYYVTISPTATPYVPIPGDVYYFWFVLNAASGTFQVYLANGSESGTNTDTGGLGATPTLMWGTTTTNGLGSVITFGFRNVTVGGLVGQPVNYIGTGPGSTLGTVPQNEFANIYVDQFSQNLTNPVTGAPPNGAPQVLVQPQSLELFAGETANFTIVGSAGVGFQWESNGVKLVNGGSVSGATTSSLVISNVTAADAVTYTCVINNPATAAFASSTPATLTIVTPSGAFETALAAAAPSHFYSFNDTGNPSTGSEIAYDYAGSDNGIYGANTQNGFDSIYGPLPVNGFTGFTANNYAAQFAGLDEPNNVTIDSSWNLDTNTVTITAWINPNTPSEVSSTAIVLNRGAGTDVEGLIINTSGNYTLGYEWNGDANTTGWDSGLLAPANQWSFVALTVTPSNAVISMMNTNGVYSSTHVYPHVAAPFAGTTMIGDDPGTATGALTFNGIIDEVGVFSQALSQSQLQSMFTSASGLSDLPPTNTIEMLTPGTLFPAQSAMFSSVDEGSVPMIFTWQINGVNVTDGANSIGTFYGSATPDLLISNLTAGAAGNSYNITLVSSNAFGSYTSAPVTLTVATPSGPQSIATTEREAAGLDWNTGASWSDGNPVSVSIYSEPGSTYFIIPGTLERSPVSTNAAFPGDVLVIQGNGVLLDGNAGSFATETTTGELRLKEDGVANGTNFGTLYTVGGVVTFPDLQLAGGQIDNGNSSEVVLAGEIDVLTNSSIYCDSASAASIRSFDVTAYLTGTGTLTYSFLGTSTDYAYNDLIVSCPSNIFSGQWNIGPGGLLGNASNSLGTNSITVNAGGMLETTYNLVASNATLTLNGQMYLYTTDLFYAMSVNGSNLPPGTYTFAQLNTAFPQAFPSTWPVQLGSFTASNAGVGSITVLASLPPLFANQPISVSLYPGQSAQFSPYVLYATNYQWWFTNLSNVGMELMDGGGITGSASDFLTISNVSAANAGTYVLIAGGPGGSATSSNAVLTILTPNPGQSIDTTEFEAIGSDWNTGASWSDGNPVSVSIYAEPDSTYYIVPGTMERSPATAAAVFPGIVMVVQGNGVLLDGNAATFTTETTTGELRLKEAGDTLATNYGEAYTQGGTVTFPDLQLTGGQIDNGSISAVALYGEMDVISNSSIYADGASGVEVRSIDVFSYLTGDGTLTYAFLGSNIAYASNDLIISGTSNIFSGQWNIESGGLLGNAPNSLGTNSITISTNGILETTYNLYTSNGSLTLLGQMYLYTADTFYSVAIDGTNLSPGTYSFARLNGAYPSNFPAIWPVQLGSATGTNTGLGSITVLTGPPPAAKPVTIVGITLLGGNLTFSGTNGAPFGTFHLLTTTNLALSVTNWTVLTNGSFNGSGNFSITVPATPGDKQQFYSIESP